jgi:hypothetical protein
MNPAPTVPETIEQETSTLVQILPEAGLFQAQTEIPTVES